MIEMEIDNGSITPQTVKVAMKNFGKPEMAIHGIRELAQDQILDEVMMLAVDTAATGGIAQGVKLIFGMIEGIKKERNKENSLPSPGLSR